ncbi:hypothetical protein [Streptomyces sp. TE33382]
MSGIDWGDAPTWIAGGFAAVAAFYARGTLKSQQNQIAEQREFIAERSRRGATAAVFEENHLKENGASPEHRCRSRSVDPAPAGMVRNSG